jgi:hypothetical protein
MTHIDENERPRGDGFVELREKHDADDASFSVDEATPLKEACHRDSFDFRQNTTEIGTVSNIYFVR